MTAAKKTDQQPIQTALETGAAALIAQNAWLAWTDAAQAWLEASSSLTEQARAIASEKLRRDVGAWSALARAGTPMEAAEILTEWGRETFADAAELAGAWSDVAGEAGGAAWTPLQQVMRAAGAVSATGATGAEPAGGAADPDAEASSSEPRVAAAE